MPDPFLLPKNTNFPVYKNINEVSPVLREEAGYFVNALEKVANTIEIPYQTLLQVGKNIGETILQKELGNDTFATDLKNALSGKSHLSFHDVMRSVNLDDLDVALPDFMLLNENDDKWQRWSTAILTGVATSFVASPIVGITAGLATNEALYGKGVVSSFADIAFDPANKIRILPKTAKGLGVSDDVMRTLTKQNRLEDFVSSGFAYLPKKGASKATQNLYEVTLHGLPQEIQATLGNTLKSFENLTPNKLKGVVTDEGLILLEQSKNKIVQSELHQIAKAGVYGADDLVKEVVDTKQSSLLGSLLAGDRHLFDFKGSSGLVLTQNTPFAGKFLVPTHVNSIDAGNFLGGNMVAGVMDKSIDFLGANIQKIPGIKQIAEFESKHVQPLTNFVANKVKAPFVSLGVVGGDQALKGRRAVELVLADKAHPAYGSIVQSLNDFAGKTIEDKVNGFEDALRQGFEKQAKGISVLDRESDIYIKNAWDTIKKMTILNIADAKLVKNAKEISFVGGEDVVKAMEEGFRRQANLTVEELQNLSPLDPANYNTFLDAYNTSVLMKENINSFLVSDAIKKNIEQLKDVEELKAYLKQVNPALLAQIDQLGDIHLPFSTKLEYEVAREEWKKVVKGATSEGSQELNFYLQKNNGFFTELTVQKQALEAQLDSVTVSATKSASQVLKEKALLQKELDKVKEKMFKHLDDEDSMIKMLKDTDIYDSALVKLKKLRKLAEKELKKTSDGGAITKEVESLKKGLANDIAQIDALEKEISTFEGQSVKYTDDLAKAEKELHEANMGGGAKKKKKAKKEKVAKEVVEEVEEVKATPKGSAEEIEKARLSWLELNNKHKEIGTKVYQAYSSDELSILISRAKANIHSLKKDKKLQARYSKKEIAEAIQKEEVKLEIAERLHTFEALKKGVDAPKKKEILPKKTKKEDVEITVEEPALDTKKIAELEAKVKDLKTKVDEYKGATIDGKKAKLEKIRATKIANEEKLANLKAPDTVPIDDASISKLNRLKTLAEATENPKAVNEYIRFREGLKKGFKNLLDDPEVLNDYIKKTPKLKKKAEIIARREGSVSKAEAIAKEAESARDAVLEGIKTTDNDLRAVTKLNASLSKVLELRGKEVLDMSLIPEASRRIYAKAMELLGDKFNAQFKIVFDNAKALGKVDEFDFQVAQILKGMNVDKTQTLVMRLSQTADVLDASNLMARGIYEFLDAGTKQKIVQLLGNENTEKKFIEMFASGILNPTPLLDNFSKEAKGFFGTLHDAVRKAFAYVGELFQIPKFKNEAVRERIFEYIRGADLKVSTKEIKGDELIQVKTLINQATGEIVDPIKMREVLNRTLEELQKIGFISKSGGIEVGLDGVAWSPLVMNNKAGFQELVLRSRGAMVDIANKGQIGEQELVNWQRMLADNPDIVNALVKEHHVVGENLMREFLEAKDFTGLATPQSAIYSAIVKIASAFDVIPYESFNNDFGLLFRTQINVLKSLEAVPVVEFLKKYLAFDTVERLLAKENDQISHTFKRWSLSQNSFGGADQTTMVDNEVYLATLKELGAYLNNIPANEFSENLRDIRSILRLKTVTADKFDELRTKIMELGDGGNAKEAGVRQQLNTFISDFMERQGNEVANAEIYIDRMVTDPKVAGEMKKLMKDRLDTLYSPQENGGYLGGTVASIIDRGDNRDTILNLQDELAKSQNATYANFASRKYTSLFNENEISNFKGFRLFEAKRNKDGQVIDNPLSRGFDGQLIPLSLHKVLNTVAGDPVEQLGEFAQKMRDWLIGVGEQEAKEATKRRFSIINEHLPEFAKLGERSEKFFSNLYEHLNYDYLLNLFKAHSLLSPAFHARNIISGYYVNSVHNVSASDGVAGLEASRYVRTKRFNPANYTVDRAGEVHFKNQGLTAYDRKMHTLIAEAQHAGVMGGGAISEIVKADMSNRGWLNPMSLDFGLLTANRKIAEFSEDSMRLSAFKHAREVLGYSTQDAGDFVKMLHFDYNLLTDFEREGLKRLIPFYTYMRKAIARDSRLFVERTGSFVRTASMVHDAESGVPPEQSSHVNSFIKDRMGVNVHVGEDGRHYYLLLGGVIPSADLALQGVQTKELMNMEPSDAMKNIMLSVAKRATPYLTKFAEAIFNYDFYFNKPIREVQAEFADMFGATVDARQAYYLQQVRFIRDMNKLTHLVFDMKNSVRPDFPAPSESEFGRLPSILALGAGIDIRTNDKPLDNNYYNNVLPRKKRYEELMREVKRQSQIGNTPNYHSAVQQVRDFLRGEKDDYVKRNSANNQILAELENKAR